jgi:hypothetical protein
MRVFSIRSLGIQHQGFKGDYLDAQEEMTRCLKEMNPKLEGIWGTDTRATLHVLPEGIEIRLGVLGGELFTVAKNLRLTPENVRIAHVSAKGFQLFVFDLGNGMDCWIELLKSIHLPFVQ